jgi:dUTP pyrophosphatase
MREVKVFKLDKNAIIPTRAYPTDAGMDLYCMEPMRIPASDCGIIKTNIAVQIPEGCIGKIFDRSSLGSMGLTIAAGVIDAGYSGSLDVVMYNVNCRPFKQFSPGDKVAQLVIMPIVECQPIEVTELWKSERGEKGFGSSGR